MYIFKDVSYAYQGCIYMMEKYSTNSDIVKYYCDLE